MSKNARHAQSEYQCHEKVSVSGACSFAQSVRSPRPPVSPRYYGHPIGPTGHWSEGVGRRGGGHAGTTAVVRHRPVTVIPSLGRRMGPAMPPGIIRLSPLLLSLQSHKIRLNHSPEDTSYMKPHPAVATFDHWFIAIMVSHMVYAIPLPL